MNIINKNSNPFYVYTDKNALYIKSINSHTEKLYSNVITYCANVDSNNKIHLCCIDSSGKLVHITNNNNHWKKNIISKISNNVKNIKNMKLYIVNNFLNIFVVEENLLCEDLYRISHYNVSQKNYKLSRYQINNVIRNNSSMYKLTLDSLSNFILQYKSSSNFSRGEEEKTLIFNNTSRTWITPGFTPLVNTSSNDSITSDIKSDLFEYCYSISYKI